MEERPLHNERAREPGSFDPERGISRQQLRELVAQISRALARLGKRDPHAELARRRLLQLRRAVLLLKERLEELEAEVARLQG